MIRNTIDSQPEFLDWNSLDESSMSFPNHHKLEDMAYLMALRKLLMHQAVFVNDIITLKESAKELAISEIPENPNFSFCSPTNEGAD